MNSLREKIFNVDSFFSQNTFNYGLRWLGVLYRLAKKPYANITSTDPYPYTCFQKVSVPVTFTQIFFENHSVYVTFTQMLFKKNPYTLRLRTRTSVRKRNVYGIRLRIPESASYSFINIVMSFIIYRFTGKWSPSSACVCRRPSWTPKTQPNDSSAVVWLSFWCSTRFAWYSHLTKQTVQSSKKHF